MEYSALLLDYGGVYAFDYDPASWRRALASACNCELDQLKNIDTRDLDCQIGAAKLAPDEYLAAVAARLGQTLNCNVDRFIAQLVASTPLPSREMVELVKLLRASNIKVGLISDVIEEVASYIDAHGGYDGFDVVLRSCKVGTCKASKRIFERALRELDEDPDRVLYVDDRQYCIEAAASAGLRNVLYGDHQAIASAEQLSVSIRKVLLRDVPETG